VAAASQSTSDPSLEALDPTLDHFARLGLERSFGIGREAIESAYLDLSRRYHPDRFAAGTSGERRLAMEHSSLLNEAYRTLRGPVTRAEYLVRLGGIDLDSSDPQGGAPRPDQAFLMEMLERREELGEHLEQGGEPLESARESTEAELDELLDRAVEALVGGDIRAAAVELMKRRYIQRYLDEIEAAQGEGD
jgi:molecular chaperone HscB